MLTLVGILIFAAWAKPAHPVLCHLCNTNPKEVI